VALEVVANLAAAGGAAELVGDVADMAEGAGDVALLDRAVKLGGLPAADNVDEIGHVAVFALEFLDQLAGAIKRPGLEIAVGDDAAALAVDDVADADTMVFVHGGGSRPGGLGGVHRR